MAQSLKEKTARGILWGSLNNGGQQMLNLVFGIFLGRLLSPSDYGMVGMLTIFTILASALQESGFISALNKKENVSQRDFNAVFWFNVLCGITLYIILFFAAPLIASWYGKPVLTPLARLTFLGFVFASFGTTPRAVLFRSMRVKETAWMSLTALALSGITGIVLAWNGFSYWGIAIQNIVYCAMMTAGSWWFSGWRPSLRIDLRPLREMIGFSSKLLFTNIFTGVNNNLFSIFFGKLYGEHTVGVYNQANKWTGMGYTFLIGTLWGVTQPVFARIADDRVRQRRAFRKMLRFTAMVSCPALFGLALIAQEFITILITDKWLESAYLMQILCIGGAFAPISSFYSNYLISQGRSSVFFWNTVVLCLLQMGALFVFYPYGVERMVEVYTALGIVWIVAWHHFVRKQNGLRLFEALLDIVPFVLCAAAAMAAGWGASLLADGNIYGSISLKIVAAAATYVLLMWGLKVKVFRECLEFVFKRKTGEAE